MGPARDPRGLALNEIRFFCPGLPKPQGSKNQFGAESSKMLAPWRQDVAWHARQAANGRRIESATYLRARFFFKRPQAHFGTGRNANRLKEGMPLYRDGPPDLDKLLRALCDALVIGQVIVDDRLVVKCDAEKRYGDPGVEVVLIPL